MHHILYLSYEDVKECKAVSFDRIPVTMRKVFECHYKNDFVMPHKTVLKWGEKAESENIRGRINALPAFIGGAFDGLGLKWIGSFPGNRGSTTPRATALIILNDPYTGIPLCIMEGAYISAMRTVGTNLLAAEYLCKPDSHVIAIIGTGVQNRFQLEGFLGKFPAVKLVKVFNRTRENAEYFKNQFPGNTGIIEIADSVAEAASDADIVISATTCNEPLIKKSDLKPGVTYFHFSGNECEYSVINEFDKIFVDDWDSIVHRCNLTPALMYKDGLLDEKMINGHLGELVMNKIPGRQSDESIIFCAMGMAIEDVAVAQEVYSEAKSKNIGLPLPLWNEMPPLLKEMYQ